jgi:hypothetical protein
VGGWGKNKPDKQAAAQAQKVEEHFTGSEPSDSTAHALILRSLSSKKAFLVRGFHGGEDSYRGCDAV